MSHKLKGGVKVTSKVDAIKKSQQGSDIRYENGRGRRHLHICICSAAVQL